MNPNTKYTIHIICDDLYDHNRSYTETNKGDVRESLGDFKSYTDYFTRLPKTKEKAYYYIYVLDLEKGTNELVFSYEQPEKKRMEINVKAKPKAKSSASKFIVTPASQTHSWINANTIVGAQPFASLFDPLTASAAAEF